MSKDFIDRKKAQEKDDGMEPNLWKAVYTENEKKRGNYAIPRAIVDMLRNLQVDSQTYEREMENLELSYGQWTRLKKAQTGTTIKTQDKGNVQYGTKRVNHYGGIETIVSGKASDILSQGLRWDVRDWSRDAIVFHQEQQIVNVKRFLSAVHVKPKLDKVRAQVNSELGLKTGLDNVDEEVFRERERMVNQRIDELIDPSIKKALNSNKTPTQRLMKKLLEISLDRFDFEYELQKKAIASIANYKMFFRRRFLHNKVEFEALDEINSVYRLSNRSEFMEDGLMFKNRRYLSPIELIAENVGLLTAANIKSWDECLVKIPDGIHQTMVGGIDSSHFGNTPVEMINPDVTFDIPNKEVQVHGGYKNQVGGVTYVPNLMEKLTNAFYNNKKAYCIDYCTWRWSTPAYLVGRETENGEIQEVIRGGHYRKSPANGDIYTKKIVLPMTWECDADSAGNYLGLGPVENQYLDPFDYQNPVLGVFGAVFNSDNGRIKNISEVELAKVHQLRKNTITEKVHDNIVKDRGQVLFIDDRIIESKYNGGLENFLNMLMNQEIILYSKDATNRKGYDYSDVRVLDLSKRADINSGLAAIAFFDDNIRRQLRTTGAREGELNSYTGQARLQVGLDNVNRQNYKLFWFWNKVKERMLNALMHGALHKYNDHDEILKAYLDDELYAHMKNNMPSIKGSVIKAKIIDTLAELQDLKELKNYLKNYAATDGDIAFISKANKAKTTTEVVEMAEELTERTRADRQKNAQIEAEGRKAEADRVAEVQKRAQDMEYGYRYDQLENSRKNTLINSMIMANARDSDRDGVPDDITKNRETWAFKNKLLDKEIAGKRLMQAEKLNHDKK